MNQGTTLMERWHCSIQSSMYKQDLWRSCEISTNIQLHKNPRTNPEPCPHLYTILPAYTTFPYTAASWWMPTSASRKM